MVQNQNLIFFVVVVFNGDSDAQPFELVLNEDALGQAVRKK